MGNTTCNCQDCQLKDIFFSNIKTDELLNICDLKVEKQYSKGESIIQEGDLITEFLYMKEGLVKLSKTAINGKDQIISFSKPFDFVSLLSVFSSSQYKYSVTAIEETTVCILQLSVVKNFAQENALFVMDIMAHISEITDNIIHDNLEIKRKHLKGRIAHVLLYFSDYIYKNDEFELPISRREIAEYIGMTTENVIRTLSEFRKDEIIKIVGKDILIVDKKRLKSISEFG
ncbi:Crp/Fnr family transcriptional regulator [Draconibacterium halophilum]|uniref:Crp/Fnr family transcriptional regulator n=1 Tax=Draconibacterium halophilum TaxID=2706887 RepID=A0A6C0RGU6_9BACT|nr:Crp/Fnr family transcriptional regulator [Draconibacterium halophilum]QIA09744.1 Crp/Fnr family transcriptional regulator [Draconibacterium halophilum]